MHGQCYEGSERAGGKVGMLSIGWSGEPLCGRGPRSRDPKTEKEQARRRVSQAVDIAGIKVLRERERENRRQSERQVGPGCSRPGVQALCGAPWARQGTHST